MYTYCCLLARFSILVAQVLKLVFLFANRFTKSDWLMMFFSFFFECDRTMDRLNEAVLFTANDNAAGFFHLRFWV